MQDTFAALARQELEDALSIMPSDPIHRFVIFTETTRVLDYWTVFRNLLPAEYCPSAPDFTLLQWGWNLAAEHLFTAVNIPGAFPISESTEESRLSATSLLYRLGISVLLHRVSEMMRYGYLGVECNKEGFTVRQTEHAADQFLDNLEFDRLDETEALLNDCATGFSNGWKLIDIDDYLKLPSAPGAFFGRAPDEPLKSYKTENIDDLMAPLVRPWDSGHGIMMGYGALPEVDDHFLALASEMVIRWREEAGIHPGTQLGAINGADLAGIIAFLTALHLKHIRFAMQAMKNHPEIIIPQSLTIWSSFEELVESIADYSGLNKDSVRRALDAVTMRPDEASHLHRFTTPFVPLLLSLGNGLVLRPVSSLIRNPLLSTLTLQEWRHPAIKDRISIPREGWMRDQLYALFHGTRYKRVDGNIKIRDGNKVITDIDGAVFDTLTGELALFQIKWQDYFTNDVRELRSKASNLTRELDEWAEKVESWIKRRGKHGLIEPLRLKLRKGMSISSVYLFGISRNGARMRGFGFTTRNQNLAIANWPQFRRIRYEIGPVDKVIHKLFNKLRLEMNKTVNAKPLPVTIKVSGKTITFEDLWNAVGDEGEQA